MKHFTVLSATFLAAAVALGCSHDAGSMQDDSSPAMGHSGQAVKGTPGATTAPANGFDPSSPSHYHPESTDTSKYKPADPNQIRQSSGQ